MKKIALTIIALIGLYTLLNNNVGKLPDQIIIITNPDIFHNMFIPLLMLVSAVFSFIRKERINYFYLAVLAMFIDAINRLAIFVNFYYLFSRYKNIPPPAIPAGDTVVVHNLVPSHVMLLVEIVILVFLYRHLPVHKAVKTTTI